MDEIRFLQKDRFIESAVHTIRVAAYPVSVTASLALGKAYFFFGI